MTIKAIGLPGGSPIPPHHRRDHPTPNVDTDGGREGSRGPDAVSLSVQGQLLAINAQGHQSPWARLAQSLQAGDLAGAQDAFAIIQKHFQTRQAAHGHPPLPSPGDPTNPLPQDFAALSQALESGDLTAARTAFAALQHDAQSAGAPRPRPQGSKRDSQSS